MSSKKTAYVVRDFKDAGTGESYTANSRPEFEAGAYRNYKAAGLLSDKAPSADAKPADAGPAKTA